MTAGSLTAQDFSNQLLTQYESYREGSLTHRRFKHQDLQPLLETMPEEFTVKELGKSYQGRSIKMVSIGTGPVSVLLWSQMHGNEATATMALFDIFNYLGTDDLPEAQELLTKLSLHFIPMLNPDGAELFQRRTVQEIDMNRDALALQCPESRILKSVRDSLQADWGFNLHDQHIYYNVGATSKPATISFLAPPFNLEKDTSRSRGDAMKVIAVMDQVLQSIVPGQVGKYDDTFEPRAFGDNIQKWGTRTILIESGGFFNDPEKQFIRKLNFVAILSALNSIAGKSYQEFSIDRYWEIPFNDDNLNDLIIRDVSVNQPDGTRYLVDIAIRREEHDHNGNPPLFYKGTIADLGDLSTQFGYREIDGNGLTYAPAKEYPEVFESQQQVDEFGVDNLLTQGYTSIRLEQQSPMDRHKLPFELNRESTKASNVPKVDQPATFILLSSEKPKYLIINGFVHQAP